MKKNAKLPNITAERPRRLFRLVSRIGRGGQTRAALMRALRLNLRGFYRDLETLRAAGIRVLLVESEFRLRDSLPRSIDRLPFPDPSLTLGEARVLARGRSPIHKKLRAQLARIEH